MSPSDVASLLLFHLAYVIFAQPSGGVIVAALVLRRSPVGGKAYSRVKNSMQDKGLNATLCNFKV